MTNVGWLTMHEVLEQTDLTYRAMTDLAERGLLRTRQVGTATLYDPDDVELLRRVPALELQDLNATSGR
jgi:DNA-binding transcriptional MerR regulator